MPQSERLRDWTDWSVCVVVRLLVAIAQTLPTDMVNSFCRAAAWLLADRLRIRDGITGPSLAAVYPNLEIDRTRTLTRRMWHHLLLMGFELAWARRRLSRSNWRRHFTLHQNRIILDRLLHDRPAVIVTGHFGHFEVGGIFFGMMGLPTLSIARPLDNVYLHRWLTDFRESLGQRLVDKAGCGPAVDAHLRRGGTLSLLADQHAGDRGLWRDFCGRPASCHKALALFSLSNAAPMIVGYTRRTGGVPMRFETGAIDHVDPQQTAGVDVESLTDWYNRALERAIDMAPEQYWWLHRRWRDLPERERKRRQAAARRLAA